MIGSFAIVIAVAKALLILVYYFWGAWYVTRRDLPARLAEARGEEGFDGSSDAGPIDEWTDEDK
ncbi:MAG: hypothetical protein R3B90_16615 [Planctomycetaceae bacterium]